MTGDGDVTKDCATAAVSRALQALGAGRPVVVTDDPDREDEGDLILAAGLARPDTIGFLVRHTSGVLCAPMPAARADELGLPPMTAVNQDPKGTAYTVSVDARAGVGTGISAADRARTLRCLADPASTRADLTRPGHVFPLRAVDGGVLARRGHTEAAVDLLRLAGLAQVGVIGEIVDDVGMPLRGAGLTRFAAQHELAELSIADLVVYLRARTSLVQRRVETVLPTRHGRFRVVGYRSRFDGSELVALVSGQVEDRSDVLVRVHSECLTGDVFGSLRCDCGPQLAAALRAVAVEGEAGDGAGGGVVVYVRGHEGRGIGLLDKLAAYRLQDAGADTVEANEQLGLPVDARDYGPAAHVLADLGVRSVRLLTNNPAKVEALRAHGVEVTERVAMPPAVTDDNVRYLRTKRDRMGHELPFDLTGTDVAAAPSAPGAPRSRSGGPA